MHIVVSHTVHLAQIGRAKTTQTMASGAVTQRAQVSFLSLATTTVNHPRLSPSSLTPQSICLLLPHGIPPKHHPIHSHTGLLGTHSIITDFTIPCTTLDSCLKVAVWRCNVTFAARGCNAFSMSNEIDPNGGRGAVASFFHSPPNVTLPASGNDNVWTLKSVTERDL